MHTESGCPTFVDVKIIHLDVFENTTILLLNNNYHLLLTYHTPGISLVAFYDFLILHLSTLTILIDLQKHTRIGWKTELLL